MSVLLDCLVFKENLLPLLARIDEELATIGLAQRPTEEELTDRLRCAAREGSEVVDLLLVEGTEPVPPQDGTVEWSRDFFSPGFAVDEKTGAIDYRQRAAQLSVSEGDLLGRLIPPREGQDGRDVFGAVVQVPKAKPADLRAGPNVRFDENEQSFYAAVSGRVRLDGGVLAVDDVYLIPGNVGLETGHVDHSGSVVVEGDVEAGSRIKARGDIEVKGTVEAAEIEAGGSITIRGGITGGHGQRIRAKGSVHAKFILDGDVEAGGDIIVENDIAQSILRTRGAVIIPRGRLVGGEVTARGSITIGQAGSIALVPTVLRAGFDHALEGEVASKRREIAEREKAIGALKRRIRPLAARFKTLAPKRREAVKQVLAKMSQMQRATKALNDEIEGLLEKSRARSVCRVVVNTKAFPETIFRIGNETLRLLNEATGPLQAVLEEGKVVLEPATGTGR